MNRPAEVLTTDRIGRASGDVMSPTLAYGRCWEQDPEGSTSPQTDWLARSVDKSFSCPGPPPLPPMDRTLVLSHRPGRRQVDGPQRASPAAEVVLAQQGSRTCPRSGMRLNPSTRLTSEWTWRWTQSRTELGSAARWVTPAMVPDGQGRFVVHQHLLSSPVGPYHRPQIPCVGLLDFIRATNIRIGER